jgi:hypothetical protein
MARSRPTAAARWACSSCSWCLLSARSSMISCFGVGPGVGSGDGSVLGECWC